MEASPEVPLWIPGSNLRVPYPPSLTAVAAMVQTTFSGEVLRTCLWKDLISIPDWLLNYQYVTDV